MFSKQKPNKNKITFFGFAVALGLLIFPGPAQAARVYFSGNAGPVRVGDYLQLTFNIDSEGEYLNAFEFRINYPSNLLAPDAVFEGNSIINLWLDKPTLGDLKNKPGEIYFSGLTPGGLTVQDGVLLTLSLRALAPGIADIVIANAKVYRNSPSNEEVGVKTSGLNFAIAPDYDSSAEKRQGKTKPQIPDFAPPEKFSIYLSRSPDLFEGRWFISFNAQDKRSGLSHYEVRERFIGLFGSWREAQSPYKLSRQSLLTIIEVKAVDNVGRERIEKFFPLRLRILFVVLTVILIALIYMKIKGIIKRFQRDQATI